MKFSVIIPVYNCAPYLRECLGSVARATEEVERRGGGGEWKVPSLVEVICVDDGSTDGSSEILDEFQREVKRRGGGGEWRVIHQGNRGVSAARNAALEVATGDWVLFLDGDDVFADNAFVSLGAAASAHPNADLIRFKGVRFERTDAIDWRSPRRFDGFWTMLYARRICGQMRFCGFRYGEDRVFMAEAATAAVEVAEVCEALYGYRQNPTSAMGVRISADRVRSRVECPLRVLEIYGHRPDRLADGARRGLENEYLESFWEEFEKIGKSERAELRDLWRANLDRFLGIGHVRGFNRLRARMLRCCSWGALVFVLCRVPMMLKRMGVHR